MASNQALSEKVALLERIAEEHQKEIKSLLTELRTERELRIHRDGRMSIISVICAFVGTVSGGLIVLLVKSQMLH